jgi:hypothetical protein
MLEFYDNFITESEAQELLTYYSDNCSREVSNIDDLYNFKGVEIDNYSNLSISKKLPLPSTKAIRVQLLDSSIKVAEKFHRHRPPWSYVLFLNDNFTGGELILQNISIHPKKYQLLVFPGRIQHRVNQVTEGKRFTLVCFSDKKSKILNYNLV